jgi:hypothetical protein
MPDQNDKKPQAGDARPDRAPGESGRGDLSDTDRLASHGQGKNSPDERPPKGQPDESGEPTDEPE